MSRIKSLATVGTVIFFLISCSPDPAALPEATVTPTQPQEPVIFPLSVPGPYLVGMRTYRFNDANRGDRRVSISIWYPAIKPEDAAGSGYTPDADPDFSGATYPLLLSSTKVANIFVPYLVSHGFAWASVNLIDSYLEMNEEVIDQPLDILFALDAAANSPEGLEGMIDAEHAGVMGYSFDGYNTLALSGARIDPEFYLSLCENPDAKKNVDLSAFSCKPARNWEEYVSHAGEAVTDSEDGLWQPMTDERIRAVLPMVGEGWWLFGEKGLAAVNRPVLMIAGTQDALYPENVQIFEHFGTSDKSLISFIDQEHMMIYDPQQIARMAHFAAAFFGYHLQGREDLAYYFSEDFVDSQQDVCWGVC